MYHVMQRLYMSNNIQPIQLRIIISLQLTRDVVTDLRL